MLPGDSILPTAIGAAVCSLWGVWFLFWLLSASGAVRDAIAWFRQKGGAARVLAIVSVVCLTLYGGSKGDGEQQHRAPRLFPVVRTVDLPPMPSVAPVSVWTTNVVFRAESTNAVELAVFRTIGGTELDEWVESDEPLFRIGTNLVSRFCLSASGAISFETTHRPPIGRALPDGTALPALCPFRSPLGMIPEGNLQEGEAVSRVWTDDLPGGGKIVGVENARIDRLADRLVSCQVEMRPTGDFVFRYDFQNALDPPATNFVIGAQVGANGVNALSILGTNLVSATVWNVDGNPVENGVSIADILCTNGVLRTPAVFEIRWKNTTGLDPDADSDEDGLTDWEELFLWGTDPNAADTDGDGLADGAEIEDGSDPLDADENGDGVPDGMTVAEWRTTASFGNIDPATANTVLTASVSGGPGEESGSATVVIDGVAFPLGSGGSLPLLLETGRGHDVRFVSSGPGSWSVSFSPGPAWNGECGFVFQATDGMHTTGRGWSRGIMGYPIIRLVPEDVGDWDWKDQWNTEYCATSGESIRFHAVLALNFYSDRDFGFSAEWDMVSDGTGFRLSVPGTGKLSYTGDALRWGNVYTVVSAHRCDAYEREDRRCSTCGHELPSVTLNEIPATRTLQFDPVTSVDVSMQGTSPDGSALVSKRVQIRRARETRWYNLHDGTFPWQWTARVAGHFVIRSVATDSKGRDIPGEEAEVEVRFPSFCEITNDTAVVALCDAAWQETLDACTEVPNLRNEVGFWLCLDTADNSYVSRFHCIGTPQGPLGTGSVLLPPRPSDVPGNPSPVSTGCVYPVASFHTHTPTTYRTGFGLEPRTVGPSPDDRELDFEDQVPGIVFDYKESPAGSGSIPMGHPKTAPARLYHSLGLDSRPTPQ